MNLRDTHVRLHEHFEVLAASRDADKNPVFALEHCLTSEEVVELRLALKRGLSSQDRVDFFLPWVVHAVEVGYAYSGDNYWPGFGREFPTWEYRLSRNDIRDYFRRFASKYSGLRPVGYWAEHFNIIAWPISHALLPKDHQKHLARALYDAKFWIRTSAPEHIGSVLARRTYSTSDRFERLLQQERLVGIIASALLFDESAESKLYPPTLERVQQDLERTSQARTWLGDARTQIRKSGLQLTTAPQVEKAPAEFKTSPKSFGISVRSTESGVWLVEASIPSLRNEARADEELRTVLEKQPLRVPGGSRLPRGVLLRQARKERVLSWPESSLLEPLGAPTMRSEAVVRLLARYVPAPPGDLHIFRIDSGGQGVPVRRPVVRPGSEYLFLAHDASELPGTEVEVACQDVSACLLQMPDVVTPELLEELEALGLRIAEKVDVWPIGASMLSWDGEGTVHWTPGSEKVLAVRSRLENRVISIQLDAVDGETISTVDLAVSDSWTVPSFVSLGELLPGQYQVKVKTSAADLFSSKELGYLDVEIREGRKPEEADWPVRIDVDPSEASLQDVLAGRLDVTIRGALRTHLRPRLLLEGAGGQPIGDFQDLPAMAAPIEPDEWRSWFRDNVLQNPNIEAVLDLAQELKIQWSTGPGSVLEQRHRRALAPLRWSLSQKRGQYSVMLVTDSAYEKVEATELSFLDPATARTLKIEECLAGVEVDSSGGLYHAKSEAFEATILVPPSTRTLDGIQRLQIESGWTSAVGRDRAIELRRLWCAPGESPHAIARFAQRSRIRHLTCRLTDKLLKSSWSQEEGDSWGKIAPRAERGSDRGLFEILADPTLRQGQILQAFRRQARRGLATPPGKGRLSGLLDRAGQIGPEDPAWLAEFALRLASGDYGLEEWAGDNLSKAYRLLENAPRTLRLARMVVLHREALRSNEFSTSVYGGWNWNSEK